MPDTTSWNDRFVALLERILANFGGGVARDGRTWNDYVIALLERIDTATNPAPQALTSGASISWSLASGLNATVTLDQNATIDNPSGAVEDGTPIRLLVKQNSTGNFTLAYGSKFEPAEIRRSPNATSVLLWVYDSGSDKWRVKDQPVSRAISFIAGTAIAFASKPSATTEFNSGTGLRKYVDWRGCQEVRLFVSRSGGTSPPVGSVLGVQYSIDDGSTWLNIDGTSGADLGSVQPQISDEATGTMKSNWTALGSGARTSGVLVRVVGKGGNGSAAPTFSGIVLDYR